MTKGKFRIGIFSIITLMHAVALCALGYAILHTTWSPFHLGFGLKAWIWYFVLYTISSLGVSLGNHRLFTHGSFKCHFATQVILDFMGGLTCEGPQWKWDMDHWQHHNDTEGPWDPHSPFRYSGFKGFLWAHLTWLFFVVLRPEGFEDRYQKVNVRIRRWDKWIHPIAVLSSFVVPWYFAGLDGLLLAGFVRVVFHWHMTWSVNSVCHLFGTTDPIFRVTGDNSKNNWLLSILVYVGEAWHNYHHQKADCAYLGWKWYHPDLGKWVLMIGEPLGIFWAVKKPLVVPAAV